MDALPGLACVGVFLSLIVVSVVVHLIRYVADTKHRHLVSAAERGDVKETKAWLEKGADPNWREMVSGENALIRAVKKSNTETVRLLLDAGADVNSESEFGVVRKSSALRLAAQRGNAELVDLLILKGAPVEEAISGAADSGNFDLFVALIDSRCPPHEGNDRFAVALINEAARTDFRKDFIIAVLSRVSDPNAVIGDTTATIACAGTRDVDLIRRVNAAGGKLSPESVIVGEILLNPPVA